VKCSEQPRHLLWLLRRVVHVCVNVLLRVETLVSMQKVHILVQILTNEELRVLCCGAVDVGVAWIRAGTDQAVKYIQAGQAYLPNSEILYYAPESGYCVDRGPMHDRSGSLSTNVEKYMVNEMVSVQ
jgi:hypothetical protein